MLLEEKLGKQGFHYDTKELFEPITSPVIETSEKKHEKFETTAAAMDNSLGNFLDQVKPWVALKKTFRKKLKIIAREEKKREYNQKNM